MTQSRVIPTVDLASSDAGAELASAFEELGFAQLVGHGLDQGAVRDLHSACDVFFGASTEDKMRFVHPDPAANRGYRAKGAEALSYSLGKPSPPDLFESFNCAADQRIGHSALQQPTPWPEDIAPQFRPAAERYLAEMETLSATLDRLIDAVLGSASQLADTSANGPDTMACIRYTPGPDGREPTVSGQQRMGAHSDYTTFTILNADPVPGLQIIDANGSWIDIIPEPGALLVNVGDVLAMYTNDQWPSTLHRVVPISKGSAPNRRSIAYFHYPNLEVEVSPLNQFVTDERLARYKPVAVADHLLAKLLAPKVHQPTTGTSTNAGRLDS